MEDYELDIMIGQGPGARSVKVPVQRFTLIGATTRTGLLTAPLRARFGIVHRLDFYTDDDIRGDRDGGRRGSSAVPIDEDAAAEIARRSRGTPRVANRLLRRVRDYAQVRAAGQITIDVAHARAAAARGRRARLRRDRPAAAAHDHREVRRRPGRRRQPGGGDERGAGRDRRHLRAVPDSDRVPGSHAARPRGDAARLRIFRADAPRERIRLW